MKTYYLVRVDQRDSSSAVASTPATQTRYIRCSKAGKAGALQYGCWQEVQADSYEEAIDKAYRDCGTFHSYGGKAAYV